MMTQSHRLPVFLVFFPALVLLLLLTGCAAKMDPFGMSFVPPMPKQNFTAAGSTTSTTTEPPKVQANPYIKETPATFIQPAITHPPSFSETVRKADQHFIEGKRLYQEGNTEGARKEFDAALDILLQAPENTDRAALEKKFDDLVRSIYRYDVDGLGAGVSQEPTFEKSPLEAILEMTFPVDPKIKNKVDEEVRATASQLPLEVNDAVLSYINYFSSERGRRIVASGLKRAGRYKWLISRILDEEGVPQELIHLAQAESGFVPRAVSRKSATGMWQFVKFRGNQYGLAQTTATDDRLDPEKATRAAARHLHDLYNQFGDWYLALAAYNCGPGCVDRAVQRTGYADFWELRSRGVLPRETQNYVPVILAMTIVAKNLKDYGLDGLEVEPPYEYDSISITAPTNIALIADAADRPVSELRELNPALLKPIAPAGYLMHVPKGSSGTVLAALEAVPAIRRASWRVHRVESGETLREIARRFNTPLSALESANTSLADSPETGDFVIIPASYTPESRTHVTAKSKGKRAVAARRSASRHTTHASRRSSGSKKSGFRKDRAIATR